MCRLVMLCGFRRKELPSMAGIPRSITRGSLKRYESDPLDRKRASVLFRSTKSLMREIERYLRDRGLAEVMDTE